MKSYEELYAATKNLSVLLAEDYKPFVEEMRETLNELFNDVMVVDNGAKGLEAYKSYKTQYGKFVDIVITDIRMPEIDGVEFSREIYKINKDQNIIVISSHTETEDLLGLINIGVKRFIKKPIDYDEFCDALLDVSRDCINLRKESETTDGTIPLGFGYLWNGDQGSLYDGERKISCTGHELILLELFISHKERVVTKEMIIDHFSAKNIDITPKSIRNLVLSIRQKTYKECIQNIYGLGYCLYGK